MSFEKRQTKTGLRCYNTTQAGLFLRPFHGPCRIALTAALAAGAVSPSGVQLGDAEALLPVGLVGYGARREQDDRIALFVDLEFRGLVDGDVIAQGALSSMG